MRRKRIGVAYIKRTNEGTFVSTNCFTGVIPYGVDVDQFLMKELKQQRSKSYNKFKALFDRRSNKILTDEKIIAEIKGALGND